VEATLTSSSRSVERGSIAGKFVAKKTIPLSLELENDPFCGCGKGKDIRKAEGAGLWGGQEHELLLSWVSERGLEEAQVGV